MNPTRESEAPVQGLAAAKKAAGNGKKLAQLLGISGAAISRWGDTIPDRWLFKVEKATGVPHYVLRPDLFAKATQAPAEAGKVAA